MWNGFVTIRDSPQAGQRSLKQRLSTSLICSKSAFKVLASYYVTPDQTESLDWTLTGRKDSGK
jgi:hypothetical protein